MAWQVGPETRRPQGSSSGGAGTSALPPLTKQQKKNTARMTPLLPCTPACTNPAPLAQGYSTVYARLRPLLWRLWPC